MIHELVLGTDSTSNIKLVENTYPGLTGIIKSINPRRRTTERTVIKKIGLRLLKRLKIVVNSPSPFLKTSRQKTIDIKGKSKKKQ